MKLIILLLIIFLFCFITYTVYFLNQKNKPDNLEIKPDITQLVYPHTLVAAEKKDGLYLIDLISKKVSQVYKYNPFATDYPTLGFMPGKLSLIVKKDLNYWEVDLEGNIKRQLTFGAKEPTTNTAGGIIADVIFSTDKKYLIYRLKPWSPDISKIIDIKAGVYLNRLDGKPVIYLGKFSGSKLIWSPDSKTLLFSPFPGNDSIYSTTITDIEFKEINTNSLDGRSFDFISWSTNGRIGVANSFGRKDGEIIDQNMMIDNQFNTLSTVNNWEFLGKDAFMWHQRGISPNGSYVLLQRIRDRSSADYVPLNELYLWDTTTFGKRILPINTEANKYQWANNGESFMYIKYANLNPGRPTISTSVGDVFVYNIKSNREERITQTEDYLLDRIYY